MTIKYLFLAIFTLWMELRDWNVYNTIYYRSYIFEGKQDYEGKPYEYCKVKMIIHLKYILRINY